MIARELLVKLGFDIENTKLNKFASMVEETKKRMNSFKEEVADSLSPEIRTRFNELRAEYDERRNWSKEERADVLSLNRLEKQAIREVSSLEEARAKARQEQLSNLKKSFGNLSRNMAIIGAAVGAGFGLSLRSTLRDAERQRSGEQTNSRFSSKQLQAIQVFNSVVNESKQTLLELRNSIITGLLPAISNFLKPFNEWLKKNKELIKQRVTKIISSIAKAFEILSVVVTRILKLLDPLIENTVGWGGAIATLMGIGIIGWLGSMASSIFVGARAVKALTAASLRFMFTPLGAVITGLAAAFGLLADEIYVTLEGGDSFINDFLKSDAFKTCKESIETVVDSLKKTWEWLVKVKDTMLALPAKINTSVKGFFGMEGVTQRNPLACKVSENVSTFKDWSMARYSPADIATSSSIINNKNSRSNVTQKNNFNMSITVPVGTSQEQAGHISTVVQRELAKYTEYQLEKTLNAIGAY